MTFEADAAAIEARLAANWTTTPIKYENVEYEPPVNTTYIELWVLYGDAIQASIESNPLYRYVGIISINIFLVEGTGTRTGKAYADTIAAIFRSATFSGIVCRTPRITPVGEQDGRYIINVSTPFYRDEQFS